ncbi:MAG: universal stress protein [Bacteroidota bacterium]|jgi:nucleotide-binding universal stress UspA family protein|nr:universal stress protein [Bacteroidota bacterium]MCA4898629.1 universal stress protein [Cytophagales bacterium]MCE2958696.1 universal stress protein [Flammeovirgaceae bacterium]MCZ8071531.1 universal stress protein [Cytophagales bacterium]
MAHPKIVLLTDFSHLSKVAMEYAIRMGAAVKAEFTVLNIARFDGVPKVNLRAKQIEKALTQISEEEGAKLIADLREKVKGDYKIEFKTIKAHTVADMVKRYTAKHKVNIVAMGSRNASVLKKVRLGGTTVSVIDDSSVPVLAIPEFAKFKNFERIVYASDLKDTQKELNVVLEFAKIYGSHVHMIHVVNAIDKKVEASKLVVEEMIKKSNYDKIDFRVILDENIPNAIDAFIKETKADLLTTFTHKLSLEEKLFAKSVTRTLAYLGSTPLLAIKRK